MRWCSVTGARAQRHAVSVTGLTYWLDRCRALTCVHFGASAVSGAELRAKTLVVRHAAQISVTGRDRVVRATRHAAEATVRALEHGGTPARRHSSTCYLP
jgi:hypothetical protein